ncbi:MAG: hypothetical protein KME10_12265 [Plectolyngbya sp. WJT66-NPBG17]|jgi:hypothetical protein|nr:hypothetical protein [Plectolyngbya sp. WJT66-NPBG17]
MAASAISKKILTLVQIAQDLKQGKDFNITRLTSLKSLCADPQAAAQFCFYLAKLTQAKMQDKTKPNHIEPSDWLNYSKLIDEAVLQMEDYLVGPIKEQESRLWTVLSSARLVNNQYENQAYGVVRIIHSKDILLIEQALLGILQPKESSHWGYHIARTYAERYNSRYPNSLIPDSAPMVKDIADFWCRYHFREPL